MADTLILFSPALVAHLSKQEASRRISVVQLKLEDMGHLSDSDGPRPPMIRAHNTGSTKQTHRENTLPALLGVGLVGAGLGVLCSGRTGILQGA